MEVPRGDAMDPEHPAPAIFADGLLTVQPIGNRTSLYFYRTKLLPSGETIYIPVVDLLLNNSGLAPAFDRLMRALGSRMLHQSFGPHCRLH